MRKGYLFLLLPLLTSCTKGGAISPSVERRLFAVDNHNLLLSDVKDSYKVGETVRLEMGFRSGPRTGVRLNGEDIGTTDENGTSYVEFAMPDHDSYLFTTLNGYIGTSDVPLPGGLKMAEYEITIDYGTYIQNKASVLFGDVSPFVDIDYPLLAGDKITIYYTGNISIQETYPGTAVLEDATIIDKFIDQAFFIELTQSLDNYSYSVDKVILNTDGEMMDLEDYLQSGKKLYASIRDYPTCNNIKAFYGEELYSEYHSRLSKN